MNESIKRSISEQLRKLEAEEKRLNRYYEGRISVANDGYYAGIARSKARAEAQRTLTRLDEIINRKIELTAQLRKL